MAGLSKRTVQRLAVLRALLLWHKGAYGPVRIHKTLFFTDRDAQSKRFFSFKKWYLGQYSDEVSCILNELQDAGRVSSRFDGPSERIVATNDPHIRKIVEELFDLHFRDWTQALKVSHGTWGYLSNDEIIQRAHDDPTYTEAQHGELIAADDLPDVVELPVDHDTAEFLTDIVDGRFRSSIQHQLAKAAQRDPHGQDWRRRFFPEELLTE